MLELYDVPGYRSMFWCRGGSSNEHWLTCMVHPAGMLMKDVTPSNLTYQSHWDVALCQDHLVKFDISAVNPVCSLLIGKAILW